MKIDLAPDLKLPIEAATQTFLIVGKRGSGKSNTGVRLAEQFYHAGVPFVAIDPVDNWKGLKSSRDGKGPGLGVYVFGGPHGDLPLESTAGALIADVVVDHRISSVLSVKHFSVRERGRFVGDFAQRLFQRNKEPLHIFLEEAHEVAPQNPYKGEEEMLGHVTRIWKLGRSSGLGGSAITQRPASLSKNITTQAEILIVHRTLGPQDVAAIREWIKYHGEREEILGQLATLKTGEAFVWAPDFPEGRPIGLRRVTIHQRETFDSAATPKAGQKRIEPKALASVDLDALRGRIAATIEKQRAEDPRELKKRVAELEAQLKKAAAVKPAPEPKAKRVEVPVLKDAQLERLVKHYERMLAEAEKHGMAMSLLWEHQAEEAKALLDVLRSVAGVPKATATVTPLRSVQVAPRPSISSPARSPRRASGPGEDLTGPQQALLDTVAMLNVRGITPERDTVARWLGIHPNGGSYGANLGRLRADGYLDGFVLTEKGSATAREQDTGLEAALAALDGEPKRAIIRALIDAGRPLSREELAEQLGLHPNGGSYGANLGWLRTMGLITERGPITTTEGLKR